MSLTVLSTSELAAVSGGACDPSDPACPMTLEQMFLNFLSTVSNEEMKKFIGNNVHVNVEVLYYPQLDTSSEFMIF